MKASSLERKRGWANSLWCGVRIASICRHRTAASVQDTPGNVGKNEVELELLQDMLLATRECSLYAAICPDRLARTPREGGYHWWEPGNPAFSTGRIVGHFISGPQIVLWNLWRSRGWASRLRAVSCTFFTRCLISTASCNSLETRNFV